MNPQERRPFVIVLRLSGELSTKSNATRRRFHECLKANITQALEREGIAHSLRSHWFRMDVETDDLRAVDVLKRIFGLQAVSACEAYPWQTMEDVVDLATARNAERVAGHSFAVRARRAGTREEIPFTSLELNRAIGTRLVDADGRVDLNHPEIEVRLEVRQDEVFFSDEELVGYGGLPTGSERHPALALMSGGFDSAIASWLMLRRGLKLDFLFFDLGGPPHQRAAKRVTRTLADRWIYGYQPKLHVVDFRPLLAQMQERIKGRYWQLLLKRMMMRAGERIAEAQGYPAMITGESVGQVSSQTLSNLASITASIQTPILRPLIGMNKEEIINLAQEIGTYDVCSGVPEFCALDGGKPVTRSKGFSLDHLEAQLESAVVDFLVAHRQILDVFTMDVDDDPKVEVDRIPEGAAVIDLRPQSQYEGWSYPEAIHLDFDKALDHFLLLPKNRTYLFLCDVGLKSAFLAETMTQQGFLAYSLKGGVHRAKKLQKASATPITARKE